MIEYLDHIIPGMDKDISSEFLKILNTQGINFKLDSKVTGVNVIKNKASELSAEFNKFEGKITPLINGLINSNTELIKSNADLKEQI